MEEKVLLSHYFLLRRKYLFCAAFTCQVAVGLSELLRAGWTAGCSLGWVVAQCTQLFPFRAQPSSPFSFCSGWGSDLIQELWGQGSGPWVQTGDCCVPPSCSFSLDGGSKMEAKQGSVYYLCCINFTWLFAPVENQLCPKGRAEERAMGLLPPLPTH